MKKRLWSLELLPNKIIGLLLVLCTSVPILIEGDGTAFIVFGVIGICMFFARENWTTIEIKKVYADTGEPVEDD